MAVAALIPLFSAISSALSGTAAAVSGAAASVGSSIGSAVSAGTAALGAGEAAATGVAAGTTGAAAAAPALAAPAAATAVAGEVAATGAAAGATGAATAAPALATPVATTAAVGEAAATTATTVTAQVAPGFSVIEAAKDIGGVLLPAASLGLGTAQGVLSYQAGQDAKAAREAQARAELGSAELQIGQNYRKAARYLARVQAVAGAGNVAFGGSPALLGQEALGIAGEEAATISRNAGRVASGLRREGRAAELAGQIGLGVGIGSGLVNAGNAAVRVYG